MKEQLESKVLKKLFSKEWEQSIKQYEKKVKAYKLKHLKDKS